MTLNRPLDGVVVAFDLDGTLVDTAPDLIGALNVVLVEEGLSPLPLETARTLVGRGARFLIERGFALEGAPLAPEQTPALVDRFIAVYLGRIMQESRPFPGVVEALDALRADGARLAVCTNKRTDLSLALLDALGLTSRFGAVVGADAAPAAKPDRRHLELAVERAGGVSGRAVLVGDSAADVGAARGAGMPSVIVDFGYTETPAAELGGDVLISSYADLPAVVRRLMRPVAGRAAIG